MSQWSRFKTSWVRFNKRQFAHEIFIDNHCSWVYRSEYNKKIAVSFGVFGKRYVYTIGKDIIITITRMTARLDFAGKVYQTFSDIRVSQIKPKEVI